MEKLKYNPTQEDIDKFCDEFVSHVSSLLEGCNNSLASDLISKVEKEIELGFKLVRFPSHPVD